MQAPPRTLVWLASYPKSGNTWLRAFLANYLFQTDGPASFEAMQRLSSGDSSRASYADLARGDPDRLGVGDLMKLRHAHLARIASNGAPVNFVKTHAPHLKFAGLPLIPPPLTRQAIYVIRHPLDMLVSYADHWGVSPERAVRMISDRNNQVAPTPTTVAQFLGSWSDHVKSWTGAKDIPVLVLRYEDMLADPHAAFAKALAHIGAPVDRAVLDEAVRHSSFDSLAGREAAEGFAERGPAQQRFFRQGRAGTGREELPPAIVEQVIARNAAVMRRHGYE